MSKINKRALIIAMIILLSMFSCAKIYAAEASISFKGDSEVEADKEQITYISVSNETEIGVIQGKISGDANIEIVNIEAKDNKWTVNYNSTTKEFNAYYADGVKSGDVLAIKYKLKTGATKGTIKLSEIELTTITYETVNKTDIEKTVTAKAGSNSDDSKNENGNGSNSGNSNENNNGSSNENGSSSNGTQTKTNKSKNGIIPQLGQNGAIILAIAGSSILAVVSYIRLKRRK